MFCEVRVVFQHAHHFTWAEFQLLSLDIHIYEVSATVSRVTIEKHFIIQLGLVREVGECAEHWVSSCHLTSPLYAPQK